MMIVKAEIPSPADETVAPTPLAASYESWTPPSFRVHYLCPKLATGLYGPAAVRAFAQLARHASYTHKRGRGITILCRQTCELLGIRWKQGIVGLVAEIGTNNQLYLGPRIASSPAALKLFTRKIAARLSPKIVLTPTNRLGRWEIFFATNIAEGPRLGNELSRHWDPAPDLFREGYHDVFAFHLPQLTLPTGGTLKMALRGYNLSNRLKVELLWSPRAAVWRNSLEVQATMYRQIGEISAVLKPVAIDLDKTENRTGVFKGQGLQSRLGAWQTRSLVFFAQVPSATHSAYREWCVANFSAAPEKPKRTLDDLVARGFLGKSASASGDHYFAPRVLSGSKCLPPLS